MIENKNVKYVLAHLQKAISDINLLPTNDITYTYLKTEILYHLAAVSNYLEKQEEETDGDKDDLSAIS